MSRVLNGDKIIDSVRLRAMVPEDTDTFDDTDILSIVNEEMEMKILDTLLTLHEEHLTTHIDIPKNSMGIYDIPYRAVGNKIRDISLISGGNVWEMTQIGIGELPDFSFDISTGDELDRFYVESNQIKLVNPNRGYDHIRVYFYIRPNVLTKLSEAAQITSITELTNTVTINFTKMPLKFTTSIQYDIVGYRTPNKIKLWDLTPVSINSVTKTITFDKDDFENISEVLVGDYVCKAEESPFPNIPTEMHPMLAQMAAIHILESTGDTEALTNAQSRLQQMHLSVSSLVDDRVELSPRKIKPRHGVLRQSVFPGRQRRGNR